MMLSSLKYCTTYLSTIIQGSECTAIIQQIGMCFVEKLGRNTLSMFFRESGGRHTVYNICSLCLIQSYLNCIKLKILFFSLWSTLRLFGLIQQFYFQNVWSKYMPDLLATCLMMLVLLRLPWQNAATFIQSFKYIVNFTSACTCLSSGYVYVF